MFYRLYAFRSDFRTINHKMTINIEHYAAHNDTKTGHRCSKYDDMLGLTVWMSLIWHLLQSSRYFPATRLWHCRTSILLGTRWKNVACLWECRSEIRNKKECFGFQFCSSFDCSSSTVNIDRRRVACQRLRISLWVSVHEHSEKVDHQTAAP